MKHQLCRNCGHEVSGLYCTNCGQKNDVERLRLATLADGFLSSFIGDGAIGDKRSNIRYGFLLSLWSIITRPGQTVAEYLEGRRRKYFNPVTILLLLSGFYALTGIYFGIISDTPEPANDSLGKYIQTLVVYFNSHPAAVYLGLLPFTALAYKWIFRKRSDLRYIEYAYVGIFVAIFSMVLLFLKLPFESAALEPYSGYMTYASIAAQGWFSTVIFRTLFRMSTRRAILYWALAFVLSYTLLILTLTIVLASIAASIYLFDIQIAKQAVVSFDNIFSDDEAKAAHDLLKEGVDSLRTK